MRLREEGRRWRVTAPRGKNIRNARPARVPWTMKIVLRFGDEVRDLELLLLVESMPPVTWPVGALFEDVDDAAELNFWSVISDPLGLGEE